MNTGMILCFYLWQQVFPLWTLNEDVEEPKFPEWSGISSEQLACCRRSDELVTGSSVQTTVETATEIRTLELRTFIVRNVAFLLRCTTLWFKSRLTRMRLLLFVSLNSNLLYRRQQTSEQMKGDWIKFPYKLKQNPTSLAGKFVNQRRAKKQNVSLNYERRNSSGQAKWRMNRVACAH